MESTSNFTSTCFSLFFFGPNTEEIADANPQSCLRPWSAKLNKQSQSIQKIMKPIITLYEKCIDTGC